MMTKRICARCGRSIKHTHYAVLGTKYFHLACYNARRWVPKPKKERK